MLPEEGLWLPLQRWHWCMNSRRSPITVSKQNVTDLSAVDASELRILILMIEYDRQELLAEDHFYFFCDTRDIAVGHLTYALWQYSATFSKMSSTKTVEY